MKILYYVGGIGCPNYDVKKEVLYHNLRYLSYQGTIDVVINIYDSNIKDDIEIFLKELPFVNKYYIHFMKGVLCQMWLTNPYNHIVKEYHCIILSLDDVRIKRLSINDIIQVKRRHSLNTISPSVENSTHDWLMTNKDYKNNNLYITSGVEVFFLIFEGDDFLKFLNIQDMENPWGWGTDMLLSNLGIKCGVDHTSIVYHIFKQNGGVNSLVDAGESMLKFIRKHNFNTFQEIMNQFHIERL
jgi:hypothetical protein